MKQNIDVVIETIDCCFNGDSLFSFIESLRGIWSDNKEKYSKIYVVNVAEYKFHEFPTLLIRGERLETDEEEAEREDTIRVRKKFREKREYEDYLVLKKKYEKKVIE